MRTPGHKHVCVACFRPAGRPLAPPAKMGGYSMIGLMLTLVLVMGLSTYVLSSYRMARADQRGQQAALQAMEIASRVRQFYNRTPVAAFNNYIANTHALIPEQMHFGNPFAKIISATGGEVDLVYQPANRRFILLFAMTPDECVTMVMTAANQFPRIAIRDGGSFYLLQNMAAGPPGRMQPDEVATACQGTNGDIVVQAVLSWPHG